MPVRVTSRLKTQGPRHFIKQWRKHRGLTQARLADRVGLSESTISQLETGKQGYSQDTLEALAEAMQCSPGDLLMRNPLDEGAVWSITDQLLKATPAQRRQVLNVVDAMLKTGTG